MLTVSQLLIKEVELSNTPNYRNFDVDSALCDEPPGPPSESSCSFPRTCSHHSSCPSLPASVHFLLLLSQIPCMCVHFLSPMSAAVPLRSPFLILVALPFYAPGCLELTSLNTPSAILPSVVHVTLLGGELPVYRDCVLSLDLLCLTQSLTWNGPCSMV